MLCTTRVRTRPGAAPPTAKWNHDRNLVSCGLPTQSGAVHTANSSAPVCSARAQLPESKLASKTSPPTPNWCSIGVRIVHFAAVLERVRKDSAVERTAHMKKI
eukprot:scaffold14004_cov111-Isochrysis_galbana.AAC.10